jgi:hypothetical protein
VPAVVHHQDISGLCGIDHVANPEFLGRELVAPAGDLADGPGAADAAGAGTICAWPCMTRSRATASRALAMVVVASAKKSLQRLIARLLFGPQFKSPARLVHACPGWNAWKRVESPFPSHAKLL